MFRFSNPKSKLNFETQEIWNCTSPTKKQYSSQYNIMQFRSAICRYFFFHDHLEKIQTSCLNYIRIWFQEKIDCLARKKKTHLNVKSTCLLFQSFPRTDVSLYSLLDMCCCSSSRLAFLLLLFFVVALFLLRFTGSIYRCYNWYFLLGTIFLISYATQVELSNHVCLGEICSSISVS